jgi:hypothetical protein
VEQAGQVGTGNISHTGAFVTWWRVVTWVRSGYIATFETVGVDVGTATCLLLPGMGLYVEQLQWNFTVPPLSNSQAPVVADDVNFGAASFQSLL